MKFRCERDVLLDALSTAGRAVGGRAGNIALSGLHLELSGDQLRVTGSDLDLTISQQLTVSGDTDGVVLIPSKLIADIVRALGAGAVDVVVDGDEVQITAGRSEFSMRRRQVEMTAGRFSPACCWPRRARAFVWFRPTAIA